MASPSFAPADVIDTDVMDAGLPATIGAFELDHNDLDGALDLDHNDARGLDMIDVVVWLEQSINRLTALRAQAIDLARQQAGVPAFGSSGSSGGMHQRAFTAEIGAALTVSERAAENLIATAGMLVHDLPGTMETLTAGRICYRHAQIMVDHTAGLDPDSITALEGVVLPKATTSTPPRFDRMVRVTRERLNPETIAERRIRADETRSVQLDPGRDGMAWLTAHLPAPHAAAIFDRLTTAAQLQRSGDDGRTLDQRRADVFTNVLLASTNETGDDSSGNDMVSASGADAAEVTDGVRWYRSIRATVVVTVPVLALLGKTTGSTDLATLDGYGPIDPHTARVLAAGAPSFIRLLTHPETGAALSVGRKRYKVPKDLRTWLQIRDKTCRFPGCGRAAPNCDIDHTMDWQHGGPTDHDNLAHLCRKHHTLKGETDWTVTQTDDRNGTLTWTSPTGRNYPSYPATELPTAEFSAAGLPAG